MQVRPPPSILCSIRCGIPVKEVLVQWEHLPLDDASWEVWEDCVIADLEDKAISQPVGNVAAITVQDNSSMESKAIAARPKR
ncbi:hypothetical protein Patl1_15586 [Pistacia atlantica]|uniref:Uncharacterized protein n=1 Tax=Pistacia atlantica TaxID=434234 RepID=A0ACC1BA92_9ROSI|nr:hypothetical protein Patl1_15586 [Pistacia atlantica]